VRLPTTPNRPLRSPDATQSLGDIALRTQPALRFTENAAFDADRVEYDADYENSQAHSPRFVAHMQSVATMLRARLPRGARVVEVGCGKGDFVAMLGADGGLDVRGFDRTYAGDDPRIEARWLDARDRLDADLVVLRHVLEHIRAPHRFVALLRDIFGPATPLYVEVPAFDWTLAHAAFFDITYEHVNYFTEHALAALFGGRVDAAGRCFDDQYQYAIAPLGALDTTFGVHYDAGPWVDADFDALFPQLVAAIDRIDAHLVDGRRAWVWGAATKGCLFLAHCAARGRVIDHVGGAIDVNPGKVGRFLPGSGVAVHAPSSLADLASPRDLLVAANPAYADEIRASLAGGPLADIELMCL
jgi:SAM-dependent methyltransferase